MDTVSKSRRSQIMAAITGDNLKPESAVAAALASMGARFRRNVGDLPGKPDFVIGRTALFIHGCFWHACRRHYRAPKTNRRFWLSKMEANKRRDAAASRRLRRLGYSVRTIWEHDIKSGRLSRKLDRILTPTPR